MEVEEKIFHSIQHEKIQIKKFFILKKKQNNNYKTIDRLYKEKLQ
jgi:hypothetical protein